MARINVRQITLVLFGLTLLVLTNPGFAQTNLLANPTLNTNLAGWDNLYDQTASWSSRDAGNSSSSGSALIVYEGEGNNGVNWTLSQCVSVAPSTEYSFGGHLMVPAGQPSGTGAYLLVFTYPFGGCTGDIQQSEFESTTSVEEWELESDSFITDSSVHSLFFALAVSKSVGVSADAASHFDNLFLQQTGDFNIGPSMSASWYNPAEAGHGIMIHLLDAGQAWMCWFTFDLAGNPAWICALGTISGDTIVFTEAFIVEGGNFPPLFDPDQIVEVPWGSITVTFSGCDTGMMTWSTTAAGFQSGSMPLARLTSLWGNACP